MKTENLLNIRIFGFKSLRGYYCWLKTKKNLLFKSRGLSLGDKMWCLFHGFSASDFRLYGAEEMKSNYRAYLSTKEYYKLHPLNGLYSFWIDDKLTTKYVFSKYSLLFPKYYFQTEPHQILRLADCEREYPCSAEGIIECLDDTGALAVKRMVGNSGRGFYRFEKKEGEYYVLGRKTSYDELKKLINELQGYLFMECIENCQEIRKIWPNALNTMRMLFVQQDGKVQLIRSFIRLGNAKSHGVDNAAQGGIECNIDVKTGSVYYAFQHDENGKAKEILTHPDTDQPLQIQIPRWEMILQKVSEITRDYPQLSYLGYDIAVTDDGFRIIEINSMSGLGAAQMKQPLVADNETHMILQKFGLKR